jgi:carotenoid cleavage dioxygenase-like enzyme
VSTSTSTSKVGFSAGPRWESLTDPPSAERLALIRSSPYRGGFEPAADTEPFAPKIVYGAIPLDLTGSIAANGPGRIRIGETQYGHWFDGDGFVTLLSFEGGKATFCGKYVQTDRFKAQAQDLIKTQFLSAEPKPPLAFSGAWTRGGRGHWYENLFRIPTNPANTATMWLPGPRLFALCEGGHPIELHPHTLETIGAERPFESSTNGLKAASFFSAHFSRDANTGDIYNHGYILNPTGPAKLNIMRFNSHGTLLQQESCNLPFDTFVHDSVLSQNYLVYFLPPFQTPGLSMWKFLLGLEPIGNLAEWDPQNHHAYVHVHSKSNLKLTWKVQLPNVVSLYHLVDAHDETNDDGTITLNVRIAEYIPPNRNILEEQFKDQYRVEDGTRLYTRLREYAFHLGQNGEVHSILDSDVCKDCAPCEFPVVNNGWMPNQRRRYCWVNALSSSSVNYLDGVQKLDMEQGTALPVVSFGEGSFGGAPTFVPKEEVTCEDDGYLIVTVYRSFEHRSDVVILNANTMDQLCVMELKEHVPFQFHSDFLPGFVANMEMDSDSY